MPKCNRCGKEIELVYTDHNNSIAVDPEPVEYWHRGEGNSMLVDRRGHIFNCDLEGEGMGEGHAYQVHYKSCPKRKGIKR